MRVSLLKRIAMLGVVFVAASSLSFSQDALPIGFQGAIPDDGYDGTIGSMLCASVGGATVTNVGEVSLDLSLNHTWVGDLTIKVMSPAGTILTVMSRPDFAEGIDDGSGCCGSSTDWLGLSVNFANGNPTSAEALGTVDAPVCSGGGAGCTYFPFPDSGPGADFNDFAGEDATTGDWMVCVGDAVAADAGTFEGGTLYINEAVGCRFNLRVSNPEVGPGDALGINFALQHNNTQTVYRAFFIEILDTDATVLFKRQSRIFEIAYLDEIHRDWALNLPDLEPGVYTLAMGIEGMTQGRVLKERNFTVMPGARQAPPNSVALPEYLDGDWIAVAAVGALPSDYVLTQNYPNPFNPSTEIGFALPESAHVRLVVYDVLGRQVRLLLDGTMEAGTHQVVFDASDLPSGTYLYRLETPQGSVVRTMLLAK